MYSIPLKTLRNCRKQQKFGKDICFTAPNSHIVLYNKEKFEKWFEENKQDDKQNVDKSSSLPTLEEMQQAKLENEQFKEELENLRHMMVRYPDNLNYIRLYKEKEKKMQALLL